MLVGYDKHGNKLVEWDICKFAVVGEIKTGIINYDESSYSFAFEMEDGCFPILIMNKADEDSIEKIIGLFATKADDEYEWFRQWYRNR